ncbi:MAG: hypothetical protein HGA85_03055 [Nanoarchaeota archaeon]|nr:hypothetical protein [Nanoarchaeota archaeon]
MLAVLAVSLMAIAGVSAFIGRFGENADDRQALEQAIADNDYSTWKELMEKQLTEERFNQIVKDHKERSEKQSKEAAVRDAIEDGDYDAYVGAVKALASAQALSEQDFEKLVEIRQARSGNETMVEDMPGMMPRGMMKNGFGERHGRIGNFDVGEI